MEKEKSRDRSTARDFIYLTACMLNSAVPDKGRLKQMELSKVYLLAKKHMLASAIYLSLEQTGCLEYLDKELSDQWRMYTDVVIRKNILMNVERERILDRLESEGIWYMPLKGSIIADYYPDFGMREMADNDILYDREHQENVRDIMVERGYQVKSYNESKDDVYVKEPVYNFEMHRDLLEKSSYPKFYAYYSNIKDRLIRDEKNNFGYHFTAEDFYIYFIVHAFKHYKYLGGTGIRTLADAYILNKRFDYRKSYIAQEMKELGISGFESAFTRLALKLFARPDAVYDTDLHVHLSRGEREMLDYMIGAGVFGTRENAMRNRLVRAEKSDRIHFYTRIQYILHRIYPKGGEYPERFPFFYKHVWAYVFLPVYRLAKRGNLKGAVREVMLALKTR